MVATAVLVSACTAHPAPGPSTSGAEDTSFRRQTVDGGKDYYAVRPKTFAPLARHFPIGVWLAAVTSSDEVESDRAAGINTYVALTADSDLAIVRRAGMTALLQARDWAGRVPSSSNGVGWLLADEVDMTDGPGKGYETLTELGRRLDPDDARVRYNNYGKGVLFWEADEDAARFVNHYQDVVSADAYWYTDLNICGAYEGAALLGTPGTALTPEECHRASNYGRTVERVRSLVRPTGSKPVWVFVELGHPFEDDDWGTIAPDQATAAVWSGIVAGARGVVYFNHSFGGDSTSYNILRDPAYEEMRSAITEVNERITRLAHVLASDSLEGLLQAPESVDTLVKRSQDRLHVFATARSTRPGVVTMTLPCPLHGEVTVVDEDRAIAMHGGAFSDTFTNAEAVHIYEVQDGGTCRPR